MSRYKSLSRRFGDLQKHAVRSGKDPGHTAVLNSTDSATRGSEAVKAMMKTPPVYSSRASCEPNSHVMARDLRSAELAAFDRFHGSVKVGSGE